MADFEKFLNDFYRKMPAYITEKFGPVMRSFFSAIMDAAQAEIGDDVNRDEMRDFVESFIDRYAERHVESSLGQLAALIRDGEPMDIEQRIDEWAEKRPDKIATNETTRGGMGIYSAFVWLAGYRTIWRIRGKATCPYCRALNGKTVSRGQFFINDGDSIDPGGDNIKMNINGSKSHPPLHAGCDCYVSAVR